MKLRGNSTGPGQARRQAEGKLQTGARASRGCEGRGGAAGAGRGGPGRARQQAKGKLHRAGRAGVSRRQAKGVSNRAGARVSNPSS